MLSEYQSQQQQKPFEINGISPNRSALQPFKGDRPGGLRHPPSDDTTQLLIFLVVLIPLIFTLILCTITYCIYRCNKSKSNRSSTTTSDPNQSHPPVATIIHNTQHSPYAYEEAPPSYDSLKDTKKDLNESIQLTILPNSNEEVTAEAAAIQPSAPVPPAYSN